MIIHKLISQHLKNKDDADFYRLQARDAIRWIEEQGTVLGPKTRALDLGCGHGIFGEELIQRECQVVFADEENYLLPELRSGVFRQINLDREDLSSLGEFDLVICSNVLEHLALPEKFLSSVANILSPGGRLYLSWTNWLSPWGGHEFSPFHYLGPRLGPALFDRVTGRKRKHTPGVNLFPISIGGVIAMIRRNPKLELKKAAPRYYTEFSGLMNIPLAREFLAWNCALLIEKRFAGR